MKKGKIRINVEDIIGKQSGRLTVIAYDGYYYDNTQGGPKVRHRYVCQCECGKIKTIQRGPLVNEIVHSCGCLYKRKRR